MDFELRRAREKLEKEQKERKAKAKLKLDKEKRAKQEAARQRQAIEASQRARRIDAAEAQAKADQQMEESLTAGRGIIFSHVLLAVQYQGNGDKIKLPPSCFTELSDQGAFDKGPLHFSLSVTNQNITTGVGPTRKTHAGVLEFTSEEGIVSVPPHIYNNLFPSEIVPESSMAEVNYVYLPKGTYAKLQPDGPGFSDIPNHKAVLETTLRQHATLSENDVLTVYYGLLKYNLRVLELKPSSSISVLETDIEVDILSPNHNQSLTDNPHNPQPVLIPLNFDKPESGLVKEGNYIYYKFSINEEILSKLASGETKLEVKLESFTENGDTDLYISKHPLLFPTRHQHTWSSHDMGKKILILNSKDQNLATGLYSIAVYGFKGTTQYQILITIEENVKSKSQGMSQLLNEADTIECKNCKHYIPLRSIALHEAFCIRHNIVCKHLNCGIVLRNEDVKNHVHCEKCGKAFQSGEIEKHMKVFHEPLQCPCGVVLEKEEMVIHQSSECYLRLITCRFCGDMVKAGNTALDARDRLRGFSEHESLCGSRTAPCDSCGRAVMLKDMDIHQIAVHQKN